MELCRGRDESAATLRRAHLASAAFRQAPRVARGCSALLSGVAACEDAPTTDAALDAVHSELRARAWDDGVPDATALRLQRSLFLCAVALLHGALEAMPPTPQDEAALCSLAALALGAVALAELEQLERLLLDHLQRAGRLGALLPLALPSAPMTPVVEARRRLVLRWAERALEQPSALAQLQPLLSPLLALATSLPSPQQPSAGLLRGALSGLAVEDEAQRRTATALLAQLGADCRRLLEVEAAQEVAQEAARPTWTAHPAPPDELGEPSGSAPRGARADATAPSAHAAAALCPLLFALVPAVKEPLLPPLLAGAELVVLGARTEWQRARCLSQLVEAISQSFNYYRKQRLVQWTLTLQRRLGEHDRTRGSETTGGK